MPNDSAALLGEIAQAGDVDATVTSISDTLRAWVGAGPTFVATADPLTGAFTDTFTFDVPAEAAAAFYAIEMAGRDVVPFHELAQSHAPVGSLFAATNGAPADSDRWREVIEPLGWGDELRGAVRSHGSTWGYLCLHREAKERPFTPGDVARLTGLLPAVATALRLSTSAVTHDGGQLSPGVLLVDNRGRLAGVTGGAAAWLDELGPRLHTGLPLLIAGIARLVHEGHEGLATSVVTRAGRVGLIDAAMLEGDLSDSLVAVVISAAPARFRLDRFAAAHGLTSREREIISWVVSGATTRAIAERLSISPYTVQAHLTSVYAKTGVRSRSKLVAQLGQ